jgi:hypothetical protein
MEAIHQMFDLKGRERPEEPTDVLTETAGPTVACGSHGFLTPLRFVESQVYRFTVVQPATCFGVRKPAFVRRLVDPHNQ